LGHGASLDLNARATNASGELALSVVLGGGRGCVLKADAAVAGIWVPLRGRLQLGGGSGSEALLAPGEARVIEADPRLHAVGRGNAVWVALLGTLPAWRQVLNGQLGVPSPEAILLPARHAADRELRRAALALARAARNGDAATACEALIERIVALQAGFAAAIARCPGRTYAQRRQVFMRLQRVRNYLATNCHLDIDNEGLARMANYSPWHFIRAFRAAYEETPHAFLVRQRLERARRLLRASPLAIAEIALESGFENRSAFSRLFRQRFGTTAGALRRQAGSRC
ncbi:MAG TPA: AraC family transcriptional regulator, partial [Dokdonella sp.]|nr:AraC family transcriptional regulator [Dokdonella sp.]